MKRKINKERRREQLKILRKKKIEEREELHERLVARPYKPAEEFVTLRRELFPTFGLRPGSMEAASIPSFDLATLPPVRPVQVKKTELTEEMADREVRARKEIERKKRCVAPLTNKAGYSYIADLPPDLIQGLGRKM